MKRLRIILQYKYLFLILALIVLVGDMLFTNIYKFESKYTLNDKEFIGAVTKYELKENKIIIEIKAKEKLIVEYKYGDKIFSSLSYGDKILVKGILKEPSTMNIPNTFNYKKYLYNKKIYYIVEATSIDKISNNNNYIYTIKNILYKRINNLKSSNYIKTFLLGDNTLDEEVNKSYRTNGISHLFSVSGMHISIITSLLLFYLNKITYTKKIKYLIVDTFLIIYLFLVGTTSFIRSTIMNILSSLNFIFKLNIKKKDIMYLTLVICIIINPFIIYDIGFIYSYIVSFFIIVSSNKGKSKIYKIIHISIISFLASLPITLYNSYEINIVSIFVNIILVPIISIIVFPLTILTLLFPCLDNILFFITNILEDISLSISNIEITKLIFPKPSIIFILIYYLVMILSINRKKYYYLLMVLLMFLYISPYLYNYVEVTMFDVGSADSILVAFPYNKDVILVDTGKTEYQMLNGIIPYLKSRGIRKIDYLIISHGDEDHIGGVNTLIDDFKVKNIILNRGEYSNQELELINNNINIINNVNKIKLHNSNLYFLNRKIFDNENDNSNILYFEYLKYKFLFMGDASFTVEDYLLDNYNLNDITFLKIGHHGSSTSTTKEFIDKINPKISLISVGQNNYGHPNKNVLDNLKESRIYRTDQNGSIMFKIKNSRLKIET